MATLFSPSTALEDTRACKVIASIRNDLFHTGELDDNEIRSQGIACKELLRRYLGLVSTSTP